MRILHTADWHVGSKIRKIGRDDEHREVLSEMSEIADQEQVDLIMIAGDIFDKRDPAPGSERIVYQTLQAMSEISPVVLVAGNHDHPERWDALSALIGTKRIRVLGRLARPDQGGVEEFTNSDGLVARVVMLPWVSRGRIVDAETIMEKSGAEMEETYAARLQAVAAELIGELDLDKINLVLSHMMVQNGNMGGGERSADTIFDYAVAASALFSRGLNYVALGHLHRMQRIEAPAQVWYSGSPLQLDFGETKDKKGVLLIETEPGKPARVEERFLEGGKRLISLTGMAAQVIEEGRKLENCYLRVVLEDPARSGLVEEVQQALPHAVDFKLLGSLASQGVTADILSSVEKPEEMFSKYLESEEREDPALEKLFLQMLGLAQSESI